MRRLIPPLLLVLMMSACGGSEELQRPDVPGPAYVEPDAVDDHASSFDEGDVAERPAGSQAEQAAGSYVIGTLQRNGYIARLDPVPVEDLVRSTNVIAEPFGVERPDIVVVVPYGTGPGHPSQGQTLGFFLELARALNVEQPDHTVYFAALGAEYAGIDGGYLGSRRLARFMLDQGWDPLVVHLLEISKGRSLAVSGDGADDLLTMMTASAGPFAGFDEGGLTIDPDVFKSAGFERMLIAGDPENVGEALIEYLRRFTH